MIPFCVHSRAGTVWSSSRTHVTVRDLLCVPLPHLFEQAPQAPHGVRHAAHWHSPLFRPVAHGCVRGDSDSFGFGSVPRSSSPPPQLQHSPPPPWRLGCRTAERRYAPGPPPSRGRTL